MLISTKGRYALRVMIDLAEHVDASMYTPLKDVAERQEISEKYLEFIISMLSRAGLVTGMRGKNGGYRLTRRPEEYRISDIIELTEKTLSPVACLAFHESDCLRSSYCKTLTVWEKLDTVIQSFFRDITLKDLVEGTLPESTMKLYKLAQEREKEGK